MTREEIQNRGLSLLNKYRHGILNYTMRTGKSKIVIDHIRDNPNLKFLWSTPKAKSRDVDIPEEFDKWGVEPCDITCHGSLHKQDISSYDVLILDEIQLVSIAKWQYIKNNSPDNIIGLTGTMPKSLKKLMYIKDIMKMPILDELGIDEASDNEIISKYKINSILIPLDVRKNITVKLKGGKKFKTSEQLSYENINVKYDFSKLNYNSAGKKKWALIRKRFLGDCKSKRDFIKKIFNKNEKTIIFCPSKKVANILGNPYHSSTTDENLTLFQNNEINLLSVVDMANNSLTFKDIQNVIIIQPDRNNLGKFEQRIGRSLLFKEGHTSMVYLLVFENTVEESWAEMSLENLSNKNWYKYDNKRLEKVDRE